VRDFEDHFSSRAGEYARFRPTYPAELFEWLAAIVPSHSLAVDLATGSGQAAVGVASHFDAVIAIDASSDQLAHATPHPNVEYRIAPADETGIPAHAAALVTVAQALHWLPLTSVFDEVARVLLPDGVFACWGYRAPSVSPEFDASLAPFYHSTLGPYWAPQRAMVDAEYRNVRLPFREISAPRFELKHWLTGSEFAGYVRTWSAVQNYTKQTGRDPLPMLAAAIEREWRDEHVRKRVSWPLFVRAGRA
jgi:ubiquinone/menaquinone biosynthesis C-methylase UbiE